MSGEHSDVESPPKRSRWWLWVLLVLTVLLASPAVYKWWWRTTLTWSSEAHALADQGRYEEAIALLDRAIRLSPDSDVRNGSYASRASFYVGMGEFEQAIEDMDRAVAWDGEHKGWLLVPDVVTRGIYKLEAGRLDDAVSDFELALQLVAQDDDTWRQRHSHFAAMAHYYRGIVYEQEGRDTDAQLDFQAAEELDPEWFVTVSRTDPDEPN